MHEPWYYNGDYMGWVPEYGRYIQFSSYEEWLEFLQV